MNRKFGDMNSQKFAADNSIPEEVKKFVKKSLTRRSLLAGVGGVGAAVALSACSSGGSEKAAANHCVGQTGLCILITIQILRNIQH